MKRRFNAMKGRSMKRYESAARATVARSEPDHQRTKKLRPAVRAERAGDHDKDRALVLAHGRERRRGRPGQNAWSPQTRPSDAKDTQ